MITEEIIKNFFEGKCDPREAAGVYAWLQDNPGKWKEFIGEEEWEDFQPPHVLSPDRSGKLWNNIKRATISPKWRYPYFRWMAVAASVVLAISLSWLFIFKDQKKNISNNTSRKKILTLSDGSTVELQPNSTLSCPNNFNSSRDVNLQGEATFNVAKDVAKPFSVSSHSVLITVLGTRFTVNSYEADNATKITLHEGKVRVKIPKQEYYLTSGDIFFSSDSLLPRIFHLEKDKDDRYVFSNYPLDVVFDQLQIICSKKIIYDKKVLGNRSFIGKIDKKDPLGHILKSITLLNKFDLHQEGDCFFIRGPY